MSNVSDIINGFRPEMESFEELYKKFHANPELTFLEKETAATIASKLSEFNGLKIVTDIGGHGVAAVLRNGDGPTVLLRADFDALPLEENTGLPYASKKRMVDHEGREHPVMHACGHDMHATCLLAAAQLLVDARERWAGILVLIFQPAEEKGAGARAMVDDGLYTTHGIPIPDVVLGAHLIPLPAGTVGSKPGFFMPCADSIRITLHGRGGHGSQPQRAIDPVVLAAYTITALQTIVSRETAPFEHAVVTVGAVNAGTAENIIASKAELKVNIRTTSSDVRDRILRSVKRITNAVSEAHGAVAPPTFEQISTYPLTTNDASVVEKLGKNFSAYFGEAHDPSTKPMSASEDFQILASSVNKPSCFWVYGGIDPELWEKKKNEGRLAEDIPDNHSPFFAPVIQPTLQAGLESYAVAALTWLAK